MLIFGSSNQNLADTVVSADYFTINEVARTLYYYLLCGKPAE